MGFPVCHTVGLRRTDAEIIQLGGLRALRARCKCPGAGHFALAEVCLGAEHRGTLSAQFLAKHRGPNQGSN